jgi:hypothetical protein
LYSIARLTGILVVFAAAWVAWGILGTVTHTRTYRQNEKLGSEVAAIWVTPHRQAAPTFAFSWKEKKEVTKTIVTDGGKLATVGETVEELHTTDVTPASTEVDVDLQLDERRKGLVWYALYGVTFDGQWTYRHEQAQAGELVIAFRFPDPSGVYDDFRISVDGTDFSRRARPENGVVAIPVDVKPGQAIALQVSYRSRGQESWGYVPGEQVARLDDFHLSMRTDFAEIDFPAQSMSPSHKQEVDGGWELDWRFEHVITGFDMGMVMPQHIQPGELAGALAFSAPVSLLFFFLVIFTLSVLRAIELHPINYLFLAGAFFAFHLLFAYTVDRIPVVPAFVIASATSLALVVSYLRLVVSPRFAFREAGGAQLVYLVGFALAHFFEGFTGLAVTLLSIVTLFLLMQLTARVRWSEVVGAPRAQTA